MEATETKRVYRNYNPQNPDDGNLPDVLCHLAKIDGKAVTIDLWSKNKLRVGDVLDVRVKMTVQGKFEIEEILENRDHKGVWRDKKFAKNSFYKVKCKKL